VVGLDCPNTCSDNGTARSSPNWSRAARATFSTTAVMPMVTFSRAAWAFSMLA
jgi:hypothetical protein